MAAQTHVALREGAEENLDMLAKAELASDPDSAFRFTPPSDLEKALAKKAYDTVAKQIAQRDLDSDNLFEDMISEKAFNLDRFQTQRQASVTDELLSHANLDSPVDDLNLADAALRSEIDNLMQEYTKWFKLIAN